MERVEKGNGTTSHDCCTIHCDFLVELRVLQYVNFLSFSRNAADPLAEVLIRQNGIMPETGQAV